MFYGATHSLSSYSVIHMFLTSRNEKNTAKVMQIHAVQSSKMVGLNLVGTSKEAVLGPPH